MGNAALVVLGIFALCVFLLLNGPLWLSTKMRVFAGGPEAPSWLSTFTVQASRVAGIVGILLWLTVVSQGNAVYAFLLGVSLIGGAFLLLNGSLWLATRISFIKGKGYEVPLGLQIGFTWFSRLIGAGAVASVLCIAFRLQLHSV